MQRNLLCRRFDDLKVFNEFELVEFGYIEPLELPNEVLAVELDHVRGDSEEFALAILDLRRVRDFGDHGATLVCAENVVPGQELVLQVVLQQDAGLPDFLRFPLLLCEPCVDQVVQFVDVRHAVFLHCLDVPVTSCISGAV